MAEVRSGSSTPTVLTGSLAPAINAAPSLPTRVWAPGLATYMAWDGFSAPPVSGCHSAMRSSASGEYCHGGLGSNRRLVALRGKRFIKPDGARSAAEMNMIGTAFLTASITFSWVRFDRSAPMGPTIKTSGCLFISPTIRPGATSMWVDSRILGRTRSAAMINSVSCEITPAMNSTSSCLDFWGARKTKELLSSLSSKGKLSSSTRQVVFEPSWGSGTVSSVNLSAASLTSRPATLLPPL
ncbi:hypothetical protein ES703_17386 [subsurface metagenome]